MALAGSSYYGGLGRKEGREGGRKEGEKEKEKKAKEKREKKRKEKKERARKKESKQARKKGAGALAPPIFSLPHQVWLWPPLKLKQQIT